MFGSIAGGLIGAAGSYFGQQESMKFNAKEAAKNREFQERMARNAHQYAAEDMEKAGLNRILALGNQAATPSGSAASISPMDYGTIGSNAATAVEARRNLKAQNENIEAQNDLIKAEIEQKQAETHFTKNKSALITPVGSGIQEFEGDIKDAWSEVRKAYKGEQKHLNQLNLYMRSRIQELTHHGGKAASGVLDKIKEIKDNPGRFIKDFIESKRNYKKPNQKGKDYYYDEKGTPVIKIRGKK